MSIITSLNNNQIKSSIILYLIIIFIIIITKPSAIFTSDGKPKSFGLGNQHKTLIPIWLICLLIAIICYYFILLIRIVY